MSYEQENSNEMPMLGIPVQGYMPAAVASPLAPQHQYYYAQPANMGNYCYYPQPMPDYEISYDTHYGLPPMQFPKGPNFNNVNTHSSSNHGKKTPYMGYYGEVEEPKNSNIHYATYKYNMKVRENMNNHYNGTNDKSYKHTNNKNFKNKNHWNKNNTNFDYNRYNGDNQQSSDSQTKSKFENGSTKKKDYSNQTVNNEFLDATLDDLKCSLVQHFGKNRAETGSLNKTFRITTKEASTPYFNKTSNYEFYEFQKAKAQKFLNTLYEIKTPINIDFDQKQDTEISKTLTSIGIEQKNASFHSYKNLKAKMTTLEQKVLSFKREITNTQNSIENNEISILQSEESTENYKKDKMLLKNFSKKLLCTSSTEEFDEKLKPHDDKLEPYDDKLEPYDNKKQQESQKSANDQGKLVNILSKPLALQKQYVPVLQPSSPSKSSSGTAPPSPTRNLASSNKYYKTTNNDTGAATVSSTIDAKGAKKYPPKLEQMEETAGIAKIADTDEDAHIPEKDLSIDSIDTSGIRSYKEQPVSNLSANDGFSFVDLSFDGKAMDRSDVFRMCDSFSVDESSFFITQKNISAMANTHGNTASRRGVNNNDQVLKNFLSQEMSSSLR